MKGVGIGAIFFTVLYGLTMVASLVGNTLLMYIVCKRPEVRSLNSFMFVNMAVADLLVTTVMMPWSIAFFYTQGTWGITGIFGEITCRMFVYVGHVNLAASILCLVVMAVDRYYAIISPLNRDHLWFRNAKIVTPVIWSVALTLVSMTLVFYDLDEDNNCLYDFYIFGSDYGTKLRQFYFLFMFVIIYFIPLVIISVLYAKIAYKVWFHRTPGHPVSESQQRREVITKKKVVRMLIVIAATFAVCWLPADVLHIIRAIAGWDIDVALNVQYALFWCAHANSAINPWLYLRLSGNIKSAFSNMLSEGFRRETKGRSQRTSQYALDTMDRKQEEEVPL
ncbi:QRFP-like peptide receptor [Acropora millepora]|uniref:QRFP-like peptide receptor n=1 Tax=Acropora millepora TaxID=45264 RepID=UPI001CF24A7D|nr:QRFP-like peptide receptor [Acropora millepora]